MLFRNEHEILGGEMTLGGINEDMVHVSSIKPIKLAQENYWLFYMEE